MLNRDKAPERNKTRTTEIPPSSAHGKKGFRSRKICRETRDQARRNSEGQRGRKSNGSRGRQERTYRPGTTDQGQKKGVWETLIRSLCCPPQTTWGTCTKRTGRNGGSGGTTSSRPLCEPARTFVAVTRSPARRETKVEEGKNHKKTRKIGSSIKTDRPKLLPGASSKSRLSRWGQRGGGLAGDKTFTRQKAFMGSEVRVV